MSASPVQESWLGRGAHVDWHGEVPAWTAAVEDWGPWIAGVLLLGLLVRALAHARRYRVEHAFDAAAQLRVHDALVSAEAATVGEIVPVVVGRCERHAAAEWISAVTTAIGGTVLLQSWIPWEFPHVVLGIQLALGLLGFVLARHVAPWKRMFVSERALEEAALARARLEFARLRLHETTARTGVLLFVALFEHRVVVLADVGIHSLVGNEAPWDDVTRAILSSTRRGRIDEGLVEGIRRVGPHLERHAPWTAGERNELPDRVVVRVD